MIMLIYDCDAQLGESSFQMLHYVEGIHRDRTMRIIFPGHNPLRLPHIDGNESHLFPLVPRDLFAIGR
jgi:hypothetical protein